MGPRYCGQNPTPASRTSSSLQAQLCCFPSSPDSAVLRFAIVAEAGGCWAGGCWTGGCWAWTVVPCISSIGDSSPNTPSPNNPSPMEPSPNDLARCDLRGCGVSSFERVGRGSSRSRFGRVDMGEDFQASGTVFRCPAMGSRRFIHGLALYLKKFVMGFGFTEHVGGERARTSMRVLSRRGSRIAQARPPSNSIVLRVHQGLARRESSHLQALVVV